jgi:hypothetical protein
MVVASRRFEGLARRRNAGNRESGAPGIGERTEWFLLAVFRQIATG